MPYVKHDYLAKKYLTRAMVSQKRGIGNLLREMRERAGLSQRALANVMGNTDAEISRWEKGLVMIGLAHFIDFTIACGHASYVRFGTEVQSENVTSRFDAKAPVRNLGIGRLHSA